MRAQALVLVALLLSLAAAGCLGNESPAATETASASEPLSSALVDSIPPTEEEPEPADAPVWEVGDAWQVSGYGGGNEDRGFVVVTSATTDAYMLETSSEQSAVWDAIYDVSFLGKIRARDLAGHQQGQPIQFFDFPLEDGKTWTTVWDGFDVVLTATKSTRGFDIVGTVDGEPYVGYDYVPELKWWSHVDFLQDGYGFKVEAHRSEWSGEVVTATANLVYAAEPMGPMLSPGSGAFSISEGQTFAMLSLMGGGTAWARALYLLDPTGSPYLTNTQNVEAAAEGGSFFYTEQLPATAGEWHIVAPQAYHEGWGHVMVHEVLVAARAFA